MKSATSRVYFWLLAVLVMVSVGLVLVWSAKRDYENFKASQREIMQQSVIGAANQITNLIESYKTALRIFVDRQGPLLQKLLHNPANENTHSQISRNLSQYYPDYFSFTIADAHGRLIYDDLGEKVGEVCRADIKAFASSAYQSNLYVHPGPSEFHIDIMIPWTSRENDAGVFFASFKPTLFAKLLLNSRLAGHQLYLVRSDIPDLIEISSEGSRVDMTRDIRLTQDEIERVVFSEPVSGTRWILVDVPDANLYTARLRKIVIDTVALFAAFLIVAWILLMLISREEKRRTLAEHALRDSRDLLEQRVLDRTEELQKANERLQIEVRERTDAERHLLDTNERLRKEGEERERAEQEVLKLAGVVRQTDDLVLITDREGTIEYANPAFLALTGFEREETIGQTARILRSGLHPEGFFENLWQTILRGEVFRNVVVNRKKDGSTYYEQKTITPLKDASGNITHFVSTGKDITGQMETQERLHYLAHHDVLTGLPNRALLGDRLSHAMVQAQRNNQLLAVMMLDLDRFKTINDTLGHAQGDELLKIVATRLTRCLRKGDTIARLGGDEFIIVLESLNHVDGASIAAEKVMQVLAQPFFVGGREFFISASIGITVYPFDDDEKESLLKKADTAMYRAKEDGRDGYQFFSHDMMNISMERMDMESTLRYALERAQFLLHYQPQIRLDTGEVVGVEALIRWQHPEQGLVPPDRFIPLLEETGLIKSVGEWVLQTAGDFNRALQRAGLPPLRVAVNLSPRQFRDKNLAEVVARVIEESGLPPKFLDLEITESLLMENVSTATDTLKKLHEMGVYISMDDFGTGYSSMAYLKRFTVTGIKIDKSFIRDVLTDSDDAALVTGMIAMARALHLEVIAEGVETEEQLDFLRHQGCHEAQGFHIARPAPLQTVVSWLKQYSRRTFAS